MVCSRSLGGRREGDRGEKGRAEGFYLVFQAVVKNMILGHDFLQEGPVSPQLLTGSRAECLAQVRSTQAFPYLASPPHPLSPQQIDRLGLIHFLYTLLMPSQFLAQGHNLFAERLKENARGKNLKGDTGLQASPSSFMGTSTGSTE